VQKYPVHWTVDALRAKRVLATSQVGNQDPEMCIKETRNRRVGSVPVIEIAKLTYD
jgi:hypothetical protein